MWGQRFLNSIICIDYPHSLAHVAWEVLTMTVLCAQMASLGLQPVTSVGTQLLALGLLWRGGGRWEGEGEGEGEGYISRRARNSASQSSRGAARALSRSRKQPASVGQPGLWSLSCWKPPPGGPPGCPPETTKQAEEEGKTQSLLTWSSEEHLLPASLQVPEGLGEGRGVGGGGGLGGGITAGEEPSSH